MTDWLLIFLFSWCVYGQGGHADPPATTPPAKHYLPYQFSSLSDNPGFYEEAYRHARLKGKSDEPKGDLRNRIRCVTVSHHLFVADLIADCFLRISAEISPKSIVILGPNHRFRGQADIAVSALQWKTPFGLIQPDLRLVSDLNRSNLAETDEDAFFNEHSIGALAAFVKYSFPESKLVAIIVRPDVDTIRAAKLAGWLSKESEKGALIIASLDFSHYRTSAEAQREDLLTYKIISGFDAEKYADAFVDSRVILFTLLEVCRKSHVYDIELVHHTNSGLISESLQSSCTSYMDLFFREAGLNRSPCRSPQPNPLVMK